MLGLVFFHKSNRNLDKRGPRYNSVRARSPNGGSGIEGRAVPELACFPAVGEDILFS
jgi:hypothetical protein